MTVCVCVCVCVTSSTAVMDQALPPVLNTLVHQFSAHMKQESATGEEMDKFTDSDMKKVQLETSTHREVREVITNLVGSSLDVYFSFSTQNL